jgi:hypothetical protein
MIGDGTYSLILHYPCKAGHVVIAAISKGHSRRAFQGPLGNVAELSEMVGRVQKLMSDPTLLGSFLECVLCCAMPHGLCSTISDSSATLPNGPWNARLERQTGSRVEQQVLLHT